VRQTRGRNDFVSGIGLEIQRPETQANLPGDGPDLHPIHCPAENFVVESRNREERERAQPSPSKRSERSTKRSRS
jgi:hypothetical protein